MRALVYSLSGVLEEHGDVSPCSGVGEARGEVTEHHHRRKERHDPWIAEGEGGDATTLDDRRADEIGEFGAREPSSLGVRLVLQESRVDRLAARSDLTEMVEPAAEIEVVGVVDGRLGAQGEPFFKGTA